MKQKRECIPEIFVEFIQPVRGEDGLMRPGGRAGGVLMASGKPPQWFDAEGNPVAGSA